MQSVRGLLYLGEWHSHAEDRPHYSALDLEAMRLLLMHSTLNTNTLLMLIIGRVDALDGMGLWTISRSSIDQWQLHQASRE